MTEKTHYNWFALRDRYLLSRKKEPLMTDERYCEIEGINPDIYAYNMNNMRDYFISKQEDSTEGAKQYDLFLAHNGILNKQDS